MPENRQRFSKANSSLAARSSPEERRLKDGRSPGQASGDLTVRPAERSARYGSSFEARFGRVILQHGVAAIPSAMFHYQGEIGLKAQHVWFIAYILSHKWDEDLPYPSLSNMARCAGVTLRNIQFIKNDLCRAGMLQVIERYNGKGGRDSNAYDFSGLFTHLEELIAQETDPPNRIGADMTSTDGSADVTPGEVDSSFVARFGRVIARRGVAAVPRAVFTHQKVLGLTPQQVWFVSYIFSFQWSTTLPYPSINKMVQHTGYSRAHLHTIKAELVGAGYLRLVHRTNEQGGQDSNAYDFSGLLEAIRAQLHPDEALTEVPDKANNDAQESPRGKHLFSPRRGQSGARQRAGERAKNNPHEAEHTGVHESEQTAPHEVEHTRVYEAQQTTPYDEQQTALHEVSQTRPVHSDSYRNANGRRPGTMKHGSHESETDQEETKREDDSNQRSPKNRVRTNETKASIPGYSPYIAAIASDFSRELGDSIHEVSNMKQALNLWQSSGLQEAQFVELMQEARKLTRKYQSRPTWDAMNNKMAYYFTCLRQLME